MWRLIGREQADMWARGDATVLWVNLDRTCSVSRTDDALEPQWGLLCVPGLPCAQRKLPPLCAGTRPGCFPSQNTYEVRPHLCLPWVSDSHSAPEVAKPGPADRGASHRGSGASALSAVCLLGDRSPPLWPLPHCCPTHSFLQRELCPFILHKTE